MWGRYGLLFAFVAACSGENPPAPPLLETGWFTGSDTGTSPLDCSNRIVQWAPEDGATGVYWREKPVVYTSTNVAHAYQAWLETESGERIDATMVQSTDSNGLPGLSFTLDWEGQLSASTSYVLGLQDCAEIRYSTFRTGELGAPLEIDPGDLAGRTFQLDLVGADWIEPAGLGGVMQQFFTTPILLGVRFADDSLIDLIGAPGLVDEFGGVSQNKGTETWDFPITDFSTSPYLETQVELITLGYAGIDIPIEDFLLQATFSADGNTLGGGYISGIGDTRNLGALLGEDDPNAICELAATLGVNCQVCGDGEPYCLRLSAQDLDGSVLPGLVLVELD